MAIIFAIIIGVAGVLAYGAYQAILIEVGQQTPNPISQEILNQTGEAISNLDKFGGIEDYLNYAKLIVVVIIAMIGGAFAIKRYFPEGGI